MIREKSLFAVMPLADEYADKGQVLSAAEGSPLAPMCRVSNPLNAMIKDIGVDAFSIMELSRQKQENGTASHDERTEEAVNFAADIIRGNLQLARNVVNPIIKRAVENIEQAVKDSAAQMAQPLTIVQHQYHEVWNNPILQGFVERYADSPAFELQTRHGMPKLSSDQLEEHLQQGVSRFDSDLEKLVDERSGNWLVAIYQAAFQTDEGQSEMIDEGVPPIESLLRNPLRYADELVVVHCLARSFARSVPEGTTIELSVFRDWMSTLQSQSGRAIARVYELREKHARQKVLIRQWPPLNIEFYRDQGATIVVNGEVYRQWLQEGGKPEALMGAAVTDKEENYQSLLDKTEGYIKSWERQERIIRSEIRFNEFNRTVAALEKAIAYEINTYEFEQDADKGDAVKVGFHAKLKELVKGLNAKQVDKHNLFGTVRNLICTIMFPRTEAERILCAIDAAAEENPDITIREAGFLAVIEIVSEWVACQINVDQY